MQNANIGGKKHCFRQNSLVGKGPAEFCSWRETGEPPGGVWGEVASVCPCPSPEPPPLRAPRHPGGLSPSRPGEKSLPRWRVWRAGVAALPPKTPWGPESDGNEELREHRELWTPCLSLLEQPVPTPGSHKHPLQRGERELLPKTAPGHHRGVQEASPGDPSPSRPPPAPSARSPAAGPCLCHPPTADFFGGGRRGSGGASGGLVSALAASPRSERRSELPARRIRRGRDNGAPIPGS